MLRRSIFALFAFASCHCGGAEPRAKWENTRLTGSPDGPPAYRAVRAWPELSTRPLVVAVPEPGGKRMLYIEQRAADWNASMTLRAFSDPANVETLLEFPGKQRLLQRSLGQPKLLKAVNALRRRAGRRPLTAPG